MDPLAAWKLNYQAVVQNTACGQYAPAPTPDQRVEMAKVAASLVFAEILLKLNETIKETL